MMAILRYWLPPILLGFAAVGGVYDPAASFATSSMSPTSIDGAGSTDSELNCPSWPLPAPPPGQRWKLSFSEEFNGSGFDRSKLTPCFDWNTGDCTGSFNHGREHYRPSQIVVSNGTAKLIAEPTKPVPDSSCRDGVCTYKAGLLSTARPLAQGTAYLFKFTYGYIEARIKFPATRGFFTAFWMLPAEPSYRYNTEIDILEVLGDDPSTMFMTYHYNGRAKSFAVNSGKENNGACAVRNYADGFLRMGLDWERDHISWYIDGHECGTFSDADAIAQDPMQLILHMMVDNDWQRQWKVGLADPTLVRELEVDYIRVFQQVSE